ncbi:unnamed protein product [Taenia asiatica]|uniref:Transposase n=1 Tax=Taenia asiatica TaxID=60517 RepID=A0A0R3VZ38_TAEAS|nr:unnamed protein product [Taenia asiatica]
MVDCFTKVAEAESMKSQDTESFASISFNRWNRQHGVPKSAHGDQVANFESGLYRTVWYLRGL